jgi:hypothetical protein
MQRCAVYGKKWRHKMNELKEAKRTYDSIEIPEELEQAVTASINNYTKKKGDESINNRRKDHGTKLRLTTIAAAAVICFVIALNSSESFAQTASNLPVIGKIASVLTIRSYLTSEDNMNISVKVPAITGDGPTDQKLSTEVESTDNSGTAEPTGNDNLFIEDINTEINKIVNEYLADSKSRMQADKDAFIATGGTEEDWAKRDLNIKVDYEVKYQHENLLSLVLSADESWYGAYDIKHYYNLDLDDNRKLTLKDVLGSDFVEIANTSILAQMKERAAKDPNVVFWGITDNSKSDIDGFSSVDENTSFYLNENGKPVVLFDKYEISPGFMGAQVFVIE